MPPTILTACPYCGTTVHLCILPEETPPRVFCSHHGSPIGEGATIAEAVEDWNTKAEAADVEETQVEVAAAVWIDFKETGT